MFTSIVVGTDGSASANEAVQKAAELARLCGATLHLVTAFRPIAEIILNPEALPVDIGSLVNPEKDAKDICDRAAADLGGIDVKVHTAPGHAADALVDRAEKVKADLIVVGSRGMKGKRRVLGSVPNSVSHHAQCTVMIVHTS
jgi:nucleotide-binding universal stress UspA family protein